MNDKKSLLFAIDFDGTLTEDPEVFRQLIIQLRENGHRVVIVSAREHSETELELIAEALESYQFALSSTPAIYLTSRQSKVDYLHSIGVKPDIWIDDDPKRCANGW